jgi:hypothetical protein
LNVKQHFWVGFTTMFIAVIPIGWCYNAIKCTKDASHSVHFRCDQQICARTV